MPQHTSHARREQILESALAALAVALLCSLLLDAFGDVEALRYARKVTWDWLAARLHSDAGDVVVVDISAIGRPSNAASQPVTDRVELGRVIDMLAAAGARSIGIDIDLSPEEDGPVEPNDPALLARLADLPGPDGKRVEVRVGVHRMRRAAQEHWLGGAPARLGATLVADALDNRTMPLDVTWDGGATLPGLGAAMAEACATGSCPPAAHWPIGLASALSTPEMDGAVMHSFFVDFSTLPDLLDRRLPVAARERELAQGELVPALAADLRAVPSPVAGKAVLVGFGDPQRMTDNGFVAPGRLRAVPGVYAHAAAAASLLGTGCLYEPSPLLEKLLDVGLTLLFIGVVVLMRWKVLHRWSEADEVSLHVLLTALLVLAIWLLIGPAFVRWFRIVPDGLPIVTLGLLVEVLWGPIVVLFRSLRGAPRKAPG